MPVINMPQEAVKFEIQAYKRPNDVKMLKQTHVPYTGSPLKHPYDIDKVIIVPDPYSTQTFYYEFKIEDISFVEELPNISNIDGETITMARVWIKKRSVGVKSIPFIVDETKAFHF
jgi:inorganic pyrophosphatase